jgi:hypothetical protein
MCGARTSSLGVFGPGPRDQEPAKWCQSIIMSYVQRGRREKFTLSLTDTVTKEN